MAISVGAPSSSLQSNIQKTDVRAMSIATMLFFMWGFLTCLNDILIPHLKAIFDLNYAQAMLVQFCFFSSYFIFAMPSGKLVEWRGYKGTMVIGLLVMAAGAFCFCQPRRLLRLGCFFRRWLFWQQVLRVCRWQRIHMWRTWDHRRLRRRG